MENSQLVESWFNAFHEEDEQLLKFILHDEFNHSSPFGEIIGKANYIKLVEEHRKQFFKNDIKVIDTIGSGTVYCSRYLINERAACDFFYLENGKIKNIYSYYHYGDPPSFE